jgi:type I restriction enzyme S subunit
MSKIDKLIQELCPAGVATTFLGDLVEVTGGFAFQSSGFNTDGKGLRVIRIGDVNSDRNRVFWAGDYPHSCLVVAGDLLLSLSGDINITIWSSEPALLNQRVAKLDPDPSKVLSRYLFHFLRLKLHALASGTSKSVIANLSISSLKGFPISLPPLEVQKEIVSILDKFTQLEAELEAELEARRTQYEVTRERLLDFNSDLEAHPFREMMGELCPEGVEFRPMGSIGNFVRGQRFVKDDIRSEGQACIHYGEVYTKYHLEASSAFSFLEPTQAARLRKAKPGDVVIAAAGETIEDIGKPVVWSGSGDVVIHDALYAFQSPLDPKFVAYFLRTDDFKSQARPLISSSKISAISIANFGKITIPNPPLEVQKEIVTILDKLDALVNDITIGLPAEIAARRKQYEYYRNKLLTFKELDAA